MTDGSKTFIIGVFSSQAQKKAATEEAERQKKAEIKVLQGQLAALREIQAEVQAGKVGVFWFWSKYIYFETFSSSVPCSDSLQGDKSCQL